jgi:putative transposase
MDYRRAWHSGGTYFFTVNCLQRSNTDLLIRHIDTLKRAISTVKKTHPFKIHAWVVLPDHMHCVKELPEGDSDFATRWRLIKMLFSKSISKDQYRSEVRKQRRERGIWQSGSI